MLVLGLDLGKLVDSSALVISDVSQVWPADRPPDPLLTKKITKHSIVHIDRWPIGTDYTKVIEDLRNLLETPQFMGTNPPLLIDRTGVGVAVVEMFVKANLPCRLIPINIHGGTGVTKAAGGGYSVAKKALVSSLCSVFQEKRIVIAKKLKLREALADELRSFVERMSPDNGKSTYETMTSKQHDDLALATMYVTWYAEREAVRASPLRVFRFRSIDKWGKEQKTPRLCVVTNEHLDQLTYDEPTLTVCIVPPEPVGTLDKPELHLPNPLAEPHMLACLDVDPQAHKDTWNEPVEGFGKPIKELMLQPDQAKLLWRYILCQRPRSAKTMGFPLIVVSADSDDTARSVAMALADGAGWPREMILTPSDPDRKVSKEDKPPSPELYRRVKTARYSVIV